MVLAVLMVGWLVDFGLTALWDSISVYIGPSPRDGEKEERKNSITNTLLTTKFQRIHLHLPRLQLVFICVPRFSLSKWKGNYQDTIKYHIPPTKLKGKEAHIQIDKRSRKTCAVSRMNSSFPNRWSFNYLNWKQQIQLLSPIFYFILQYRTKQEA